MCRRFEIFYFTSAVNVWNIYSLTWSELAWNAVHAKILNLETLRLLFIFREAKTCPYFFEFCTDLEIFQGKRRGVWQIDYRFHGTFMSGSCFGCNLHLILNVTWKMKSFNFLNIIFNFPCCNILILPNIFPFPIWWLFASYLMSPAPLISSHFLPNHLSSDFFLFSTWSVPVSYHISVCFYVKHLMTFAYLQQRLHDCK